MSEKDLGRVSTDNELRWTKFVKVTTGQPPWPRLVQAAAMFDEPGEALDVGAGAGRDSLYLLNQGWRVTAVDSSPAAIAALKRLPAENFTAVLAVAQDFKPDSYDLVNAQFSLPFIPPSHFEATVARLRDAVKPGGVMSATFFGRRDEWNTPGNEVTFSTREDVEQIFAGWEVIDLTEVEEDGKTADGSPKHWHIFHVTARRPREGDR
jgi:SAM-dependent methyltransferase